MRVTVNGIDLSVLDEHLWAFLNPNFTNQAKQVFNNVPSLHGLEVWRGLIGELLSLTDLRQMDLQTVLYARFRAASIQRIWFAIENWETSFRKYNEAGGSIDDTSKMNTLLKIITTAVADPLVMTLQNYATQAALKQHAMYKVDLLMKFHPEANKVANLAQRGEEGDNEWPG